MIEYLTNQDLLLRKVLKPLVPSNVLDEHISFTKINIEPSVLSSLAATQ